MTNATWAGRSATPPTPEEERRRAGWVPVAGLVAALGLVGAGGYVLGTSGDTEATAAPTTAVAEDVMGDETDSSVNEPAATASDDNVDAAAEDEALDSSPDDSAANEGAANDGAANDGAANDGAANDDTAAADQDDLAAEDPAVEESADDDTAAGNDTTNQVILDEGFSRGALLRDGVLYLGGSVPSQEVADQIIERAEAVIGEGNVVSEYVIDPTSDMGQGAPLYVEDVVLFAYGEKTIDPQFEPLLDLGLALLAQNPSVNVTIVTHTDASGSASFNERLSLQRGQYVAQYWVDRGIPVEQIAIDARGERDLLVDDHTEEGAQLNRRAEFFIEGLLP